MRVLILGLFLALVLFPPIHPILADSSSSREPRLPTPDWVKTIDLGQQDPRLKGIQALEGVKVEILLESPAVTRPLAMTFAADGSLFVLEEQADPENPRRAVKWLRDSTGKGVYDKADVILEKEPVSAILHHDGWLYWAGRQTVSRCRPGKAGGPWDTREIILKGFQSSPSAGITGLSIGPDGRLLIVTFDEGNSVLGSDGTLVSAFSKGNIFRFQPNGSRLELLAQGLRPGMGHLAYDTLGNGFLGLPGQNPVGPATVVEGVDLGWRGLARSPGKSLVPSSTGILIYNDTQFPEKLRGLHYHACPVDHAVRAFRVGPSGSDFEYTEGFAFLQSSSADFRPAQLAVGPDGSILLLDYGSPDRYNSGRIYRLSWQGTKEDPAIALRDPRSWSKIAYLKEPELIQALTSPDASIQEGAQRRLRLVGPDNGRCRNALLELIKNPDTDENVRIAAIEVLPAFWNVDIQAYCEDHLLHGSTPVRRLTALMLGSNVQAGHPEVQATLVKALADDDLSVRRAVILAMGRLQAAGAASALVNALAFDDGKDFHLRASLVKALDRVGKPAVEQLLGLAESGVSKDLDRVVETVVDLQTPFAADALVRLLKYPHLKISQRASLIRSLSNHLIDPQFSIDPLLDYLLSRPVEASEIKQASLQVIAGATRGPRNPRVTEWLFQLLGDSDPSIQIATLKTLWIYHTSWIPIPFWR